MPQHPARTTIQPHSALARFSGTLAAVLATSCLLLLSTAALAQTFTVLHNFTGETDGKTPYTGLTMDRAGNLYGTTRYGGYQGNRDCSVLGGCGTIFKLTRAGTAWVFAPLYQFQGVVNGDGSVPLSRVIFGPDGALYGTTVYGGMGEGCNDGCGTVFKLTPPPTFCRNVTCSWLETEVNQFTNADGQGPSGDLAFDSAGNLYGATGGGGSAGRGTIYQLVPSSGAWHENLLYSFQGMLDGQNPGGVALDRAGNIYGTTFTGGSGGFGTVFQLASSPSGWTLDTLYSFAGNNGLGPVAGVILDAAGNLYGATVNGEPDGDAYAYELSPSGNGWNHDTLYIFPNCYGCGPAANLVMDAAGNLYGTTRGLGGSDDPHGSVFELTPSTQGWIYTDLHDFTGGSDGSSPYSNVVIDANGNLYGTASAGGMYGDGTVWEITR